MAVVRAVREQGAHRQEVQRPCRGRLNSRGHQCQRRNGGR